LINSVINIANDIGAAMLVDHLAATTVSRSDLVGLSGCLFSLCFLTPFFQFIPWEATHFVLSTSLYDTLYSFTGIIVNSVVTDNHFMTDQARVRFMASGKVANLCASFVLARIGLALFDANNLHSFRLFLFAIASLTTMLFLVAQHMLGTKQAKHRRLSLLLPNLKRHLHDDSDVQRLVWRQVIRDFLSHKNFLAWTGMEMVLEAQTTFSLFFLKTFVDELLFQEGNGISRGNCDWLLSMTRPLSQVAAIVAYIPIQRMGYPIVYKILFLFNIVFSAIVFWMVDYDEPSDTSIYWCLLYISVVPVISKGIQSAGFHLGQADLVLEMKRKHAIQGRRREPSLAGLFLGANGLLCKPARAILPMTMASVLHHYPGKTSLFGMLVLPPILCSVLALCAWQFYDLTPHKTHYMREELRKIDATSAVYFGS
jgi:hypothetical protein